MKKITTILLLLLSLAPAAYSQNTFPSSGNAGVGTLTPDASSALEVKSTTQGMLIPRMTKVNRDAIVSPVEGLLIYQTNSTPGFYYYSGSTWKAVSPKGLNKDLSNITAPTAVNDVIQPNGDNSIDFGSTAFSWKDLYVDGIGNLGTAKVGNYTGSPQAGMIRWTGSDFEGYTGSAWISLSAVGPTYAAGTGINISANTITNTAPTQWTTNGSNISFSTGNVGIGTSSPSEKLHVSDGNLLVTGTFGSSPAISVTGSGTRMFFDPNKAAFRAGNVGGNNWNNGNIGNYSIALGKDVTASGISSLALGLGATASGDNSVAIGNSLTASGSNSFCTGFSSFAIGSYSIAMGNTADAEGDNSIAIGFGNTTFANHAVAIGRENFATNESSIAFGTSNFTFADYAMAVGHSNTSNGAKSIALGSELTALSYTEIVVGSNSTSYSPASSTSWNSADRIFTVGNGPNSSSKSNALTVLKSGNVGIGTSTPGQKLEVSGTTRTTNFQMTNGAVNGYVLQSDANGNASWVSPGSSGITGLSTNYVPKWNGTALEDASIFDQAGVVSIGTSTSDFGGDFGYSKFTIASEDDDVTDLNNILASDDGNSPWINWGKARGNLDTMTIVQNGDDLFQLNINGYDGDEFRTAAAIRAKVDNDADNNSVPGNLMLFTGNGDGDPEERMRITGDGNIGIGINDPGARLDVNGKTKTNELQLVNGAGDGYFLRSDEDGNASWVDPSSVISWTVDGDNQHSSLPGNVGIGTDDPQQLLDLRREGEDNFLRIQSGGENEHYAGVRLEEIDSDYGWLMRMNAEDDQFYISHNNYGEHKNHLTLTTHGNLGLGMNDPEQILDIKRADSDNFLRVQAGGSDQYSAGIILDEDGEDFGWQMKMNAEDDKLYFTHNNNGNLEDQLILTTGGSIGVRTSNPQQLIDIQREGEDNFLRIQAGGTDGYVSGIMLDEFDSNFGWQMKMDANNDKLFFTHNSDGDLTDQLVITSDGNIGIGTEDPSEKLEVAGKIKTSSLQMSDGAGNGYLLQSDNDGNATWIDPGSSNFGWQMKMDANNDKLFFTYNGDRDLTDQLVITSDGNIGIGTEDPSEKLEVAGKIKTSSLQMSDGAGNGYLLQSDNDGNATWIDPGSLIVGSDSWTVNGNNQYSSVSGNVGIGTDAPDTKLHVYKDGSAANVKVESSSSSAFVNLIAGSSASEAGMAAFTQGSQRWSWGKSNGSETGSDAGSDFFINRYSDVGSFLSQPFMIKRSTGNVGVGTSSPSTKLHIAGGTDASFTSTSGYLITGSVTSTNLVMDDNEIMARSNGAESPLYVQNDGGDFHIHLNQGSSTQFTVLNNGNVGIGTTSPGSPLDIQRAVSGTSYIASISNTTNVNTSTDNGLLVKAGHNTFSAAQKSTMVGFQRPDATAIGSVQQSAGGVTFQTTSDERLKENIRETRFGLNDLMKIQVSDYNYRDDQNTDQTGYLAQQLYEIFPNAVHKGGADVKTDPWMVDYGRITPLIVKSVQELSDENKKLKSENGDQQQQIDALNSRLDEVLNKMQMMESSLSQCCTAYEHSPVEDTGAKISDSPMLEQNVPNPFMQTSYIKFYIPSSASDAMIVVSDLNGKVWKQFTQLSNGFGTVNIDAGTLAAGVYQYALMIGGKVIATKQMVLTR